MSDSAGVKESMKRGADIVARRGIQRDADRAARAQAGYTDTVVWVPVEQITIDESIQVRVGGVDADTVEQYAVVMFESGGWGPFPPVDLYRDGETLYLSAGFQRLAAAGEANVRLVNDDHPGISEIPAEIRPGGYEAAIEHAEDDNLTHGKPLTLQDKRNMFERRLARGHRWANMSDQAIARELGVSRRTIGYWRQALAEKRLGNFAESGKKIGADGREYDVRRVRNTNRQRAQQEEQRKPPAAPEGPEREDDPVEIVVTQILNTLREQDMSPIQLKKALGYDVSMTVYQEAINRLLASGAVERTSAIVNGPVLYQLRDIQTDETQTTRRAADEQADYEETAGDPDTESDEERAIRVGNVLLDRADRLIDALNERVTDSLEVLAILPPDDARYLAERLGDLRQMIVGEAQYLDGIRGILRGVK